MRYQGINANVMSLAGIAIAIAIAIGAMVDAAIVMIENAHKHLERAGRGIGDDERRTVIRRAAEEVGPGACGAFSSKVFSATASASRPRVSDALVRDSGPSLAFTGGVSRA